MTFYAQQTVRLHPTSDMAGGESPLEGIEGIIEEVTEWGAVVWTGFGATGTYRALFMEMEAIPVHVNGQVTKHAFVAFESTEVIASVMLSSPSEPMDPAEPDVRDLGYSGDICQNCGGSRMRQAGACLTCDECGTSAGCS